MLSEGLYIADKVKNQQWQEATFSLSGGTELQTGMIV